MPIKVNTQKFYEAINYLYSLLNTKLEYAIQYSHFYFQIDKNKLYIYANSENTQAYIVFDIEDNAEDNIKNFYINAKYIKDILKGIKDDTVNIEINERLQIFTNNARYSFNILNNDKINIIYEESNPICEFYINSKVFKQSINNTLYIVVDNYENKYSGILIEAYNNQINFVTTDAYRINKVINYNQDNINCEYTFFINQEAPELISKIASDKDIKIVAYDNFVKFIFDDYVIYTTYRKYKFPVYNPIIEKIIENCQFNITIETKEISNIINSINQFAKNSEIKKIILTFDNNLLQLNYNNESGIDIKYETNFQRIFVTETSEINNIPLNIKLLNETIKNIKTDSFTLSVSDLKMPILLQSKTEHNLTQYLIMPMRTA